MTRFYIMIHSVLHFLCLFFHSEISMAILQLLVTFSHHQQNSCLFSKSFLCPVTVYYFTDLQSQHQNLSPWCIVTYLNIFLLLHNLIHLFHLLLLLACYWALPAEPPSYILMKFSSPSLQKLQSHWGCSLKFLILHWTMQVTGYIRTLQFSYKSTNHIHSKLQPALSSPVMIVSHFQYFPLFNLLSHAPPM